MSVLPAGARARDDMDSEGARPRADSAAVPLYLPPAHEGDEPTQDVLLATLVRAFIPIFKIATALVKEDRARAGDRHSVLHTPPALRLKENFRVMIYRGQEGLMGGKFLEFVPMIACYLNEKLPMLFERQASGELEFEDSDAESELNVPSRMDLFMVGAALRSVARDAPLDVLAYFKIVEVIAPVFSGMHDTFGTDAFEVLMPTLFDVRDILDERTRGADDETHARCAYREYVGSLVCIIRNFLLYERSSFRLREKHPAIESRCYDVLAEGLTIFGQLDEPEYVLNALLAVHIIHQINTKYHEKVAKAIIQLFMKEFDEAPKEGQRPCDYRIRKNIIRQLLLDATAYALARPNGEKYAHDHKVEKTTLFDSDAEKTRFIDTITLVLKSRCVHTFPGFNRVGVDIMRAFLTHIDLPTGKLKAKVNCIAALCNYWIKLSVEPTLAPKVEEKCAEDGDKPTELHRLLGRNDLLPDVYRIMTTLEHRSIDYHYEYDEGAEAKFFFELDHDLGVDQHRKKLKEALDKDKADLSSYWEDGDGETSDAERTNLLMFDLIRRFGEFAELVADFSRLEKLAPWQKTFRAIVTKSKATFLNALKFWVDQYQTKLADLGVVHPYSAYPERIMLVIDMHLATMLSAHPMFVADVVAFGMCESLVTAAKSPHFQRELEGCKLAAVLLKSNDAAAHHEELRKICSSK